MQDLSWTTLEFQQKDRHPDWLWSAGLIFALASGVAFFYSNFFFGIFLIIAGIAVIFFAIRNPKEVTYTIGEKSFALGDERIEYSSIRQFFVDESQKPAKLLLLVQGGFIPMHAIPLGDMPAEQVTAALLERGLTQTTMRESFSARVFEQLGF